MDPLLVTLLFVIATLQTPLVTRHRVLVGLNATLV